MISWEGSHCVITSRFIDYSWASDTQSQLFLGEALAEAGVGAKVHRFAAAIELANINLMVASQSTSHLWIFVCQFSWNWFLIVRWSKSYELCKEIYLFDHRIHPRAIELIKVSERVGGSYMCVKVWVGRCGCSGWWRAIHPYTWQAEWMSRRRWIL